MFLSRSTVLIFLTVIPALCGAETVEFCIDGEQDLGVRLQGWYPDGGDWSDASWCVTTDDDSPRARFAAAGLANPDMAGDWTLTFLPPETVRIVNAANSPDIEFQTSKSIDDALHHRRIDPRRLLEEVTEMGGVGPSGEAVLTSGNVMDVTVSMVDGRVAAVASSADLPLRGRVPVEWRWQWDDPASPTVVVSIDGEAHFRGQGRWRVLGEDEAAAVWQATPGNAPIQVPGSSWPSKIDMQLVELGNGAWVVSGVRTGFHHLVVDTAEGLVVADAPASWIEVNQIPPADFVPGLGIGGLSEALIDFLADALPDRPIHAVALTHAHDDHAGGARAFAAAGAVVYAPAEASEFLERAFNRSSMPADGLVEALVVRPVSDSVTLADRVRLVNLGESPHTHASLGVLDATSGYFFVSDVHVPYSDSPVPREDRAETECWFANWATRHLDDDVIVINSHSLVQTPVSRLESYLDSAVCKSTGR